MLKNSDINRELLAYWLVVRGSDIWLVNDEVPKGSATSLNLPFDKAIVIGEYQNLPVLWLNESELEQILPWCR